MSPSKAVAGANLPDSRSPGAGSVPTEQELEFARRVQQTLLEPRTLRIDGLQASGCCIPRHAVGGDCFDFVALPGGGLRVVIADVMGKGFGAAMLMTMFRAAVRTATPYFPTPGGLLEHINDLFYEDLQRVGSFITAACVDCRADRLTATFASGGHPYPLLLRKGSDSPEPVLVRGVSLGMMPNRVYAEQKVSLRPGDEVVMYTDGLTEARGSGGKGLTAAELLQFIALHRAESSPEMLDEFLTAIRDAGAEDGVTDDVTIVAVRFDGGPTRAPARKKKSGGGGRCL